jgi:1-aminocyclopropane-1-carboxylate deaminase
MMVLFQLSSRITKLNPNLLESFGQGLSDERRSIWVLRDDELGGFWGTKYRKYASIIEDCLANHIKEIICTGGINSNNLAAAAVLCKEFDINVTALALQDHADEAGHYGGNRMIIRTALPPDRLIIIPRSEKKSIHPRMGEIASTMTQNGKNVMILEEGGACLSAVKGCMTLADEILRQRFEWSDGQRPDHIFIDSGTGLTAASLIAALKLKTADLKVKVHVIQMAGFDEQIQLAFDSWVTPVTGILWNDAADITRVYRPLSPRSYGATSNAVFKFIEDMARHFGILTDPIYTAKLFARAFDLIQGQNLKGRILIIHSGGISGLLGYSQHINTRDS